SLISALDTGSSFEGMGASREVTFSTFAEPTLFILFAIIASLSGLNSFEGFANIWEINNIGNLITIGSVIILFVIILLEGCRIPIDDPNTHLELTMIHEVMILDNSGIDLGIMSYIAYLKMFIFSCLITTLLIPSDLTLLQFSCFFIGTICAIAVIIGTLESSIARLRMEYIPRFIFIITYIALILLAIEVLGNYTKGVF
ncbi:MAG: NADH-quinone oxidoreductase subunit H, partial [Rickettsiales bacterium]|nr:NADH-quinone oxidoreductase subunit H [Rickettsiales bacterium]